MFHSHINVSLSLKINTLKKNTGFLGDKFVEFIPKESFPAWMLWRGGEGGSRVRSLSGTGGDGR